MKKLRFWIAALVVAATGAGESHAQSGVKYPYLTTNAEGSMCVIVSRDSRGGAHPNCIHPKWTKTPEHLYTDATNNRVAAKFEVQKTGLDNELQNTNTVSFANAVTFCGAPWRLPTIRELMLMRLFRDKMSGVDSFHPTEYTQTERYYWSATKKDNSWAFCVAFAPPLFDMTYKAMYEEYLVRCVKDVD